MNYRKEKVEFIIKQLTADINFYWASGDDNERLIAYKKELKNIKNINN